MSISIIVGIGSINLEYGKLSKVTTEISVGIFILACLMAFTAPRAIMLFSQTSTCGLFFNFKISCVQSSAESTFTSQTPIYSSGIRYPNSYRPPKKPFSRCAEIKPLL